MERYYLSVVLCGKAEFETGKDIRLDKEKLVLPLKSHTM